MDSVLARLRPDLVSGVVLEDPPGLASNDPAQVATEVEIAAQRARSDPDGEVTNLVTGGSTWTRLDAEDAIRSRQALDASAIARFLRTQRWDLPALVAETSVPVQLIAATEPDTALKGADRERLIASIPPERVRIVDSGHTVHRDRPGLWLMSVVRFGHSLGLDQGHD